jgi:hypothetical protein
MIAGAQVDNAIYRTIVIKKHCLFRHYINGLEFESIAKSCQWLLKPTENRIFFCITENG